MTGSRFDRECDSSHAIADVEWQGRDRSTEFVDGMPMRRVVGEIGF